MCKYKCQQNASQVHTDRMHQTMAHYVNLPCNILTYSVTQSADKVQMSTHKMAKNNLIA